MTSRDRFGASPPSGEHPSRSRRPEGLEYRGDERLLRRAAVNLLENAVKFSPEGAKVGVALSREDGQVELRVVDEAQTLAASERERVFERFYRSQESRSQGIPGSGLGLAIVRWAVTLHGGAVRVEPRATRGNTFVIELPVSEPRPVEPTVRPR